MAITGTEHPSSPSKTLESSGNVVHVRRFQYDRDYDFTADMPAIGDFDATYGYFRGYRSSFPNPAYRMVELTYDTEGTVVNFSPADGDTEYWAESKGEEVPLEFAPNYRTKWNYNLWGKASQNPPTVALNYPGAVNGYNNATDLNDLRGNDLLKWQKDDPGTDWVLVEPKTKPGQEFFLRPARVTFQRDYHRTKVAAQNDLQDVGTLIDPAELFGLLASTPTVKRWLCTDSNLVYDGKYWVTETSFLYSASSDGWDQDLYS